MEILDLKFAGITLWHWLIFIAFYWLASRYGGRILHSLSAVFRVGVGLVGAAVLALTIIGIPQLIDEHWDGWFLVAGLFTPLAIVAVIIALGGIKYRLSVK